MDNQTSVSIKFSNSVTGEKKLEKYAQTLQQINSVLNAIDTGKAKQIETQTKSTTNETQKMGKVLNTAFSIGKFTAITKAFQNMVTTIMKFNKKNAEYVENWNLLEVAFSKNTTEAEKFVNSLTEMYGLDESWGYRTVGMFKQLANAMNLTGEIGTDLSKTLTQLSIDLSSLYNVDIDDAVSKLQSALAGQTKPIRFFGADITQNTLQLTLETHGIDKAITDLSYAEKRLVIVASILEQTEEAQGDWARTIESTANQMRIMGEQVQRLTRAIGGVFAPIIKGLLPLMNALLMVLTEIISMFASWIAMITGVDEKPSFAVTNESVEELGAGLETAYESAKKLKSGLRGFDKLNNITTPSDSGGSAGGGTGVDASIMDLYTKASEKYFKNLQNVEMIATRIRDKIMEWLGFSKVIDEVTGDISFKFEKITSGTVLGALAVGGGIYSGIVTISKVLAKLGIISKSLPSIFKVLGGAIGSVLKIFKTFGAKDGIAYIFLVMKDAILKLFAPIGKLGGVIAKLGSVIQGVVLAISTATGLSVGWIVAIGVAIAGAIALIVIYWEEIKEFFIGLWEGFVETIVVPLTEFITTFAQFVYDNVIAPIISFFTPIVEAVLAVFSTIFKNIADIVVGVGKAVFSIIQKVVEIFTKIVEIFVALGKAFYDYIIKPVFQFIADILKKVGDFFVFLFQKIGSVFKWIYDNIIKPILDTFAKVGTWVYDKIIKPVVDKITWLKDKAVEIFKSIGTTVVDFIGGAVKSVLNGIFSAIENGINFFIKMLNGAIDIINAIPGVNITKVNLLSIPRLKTGMDFVPNDYFPAFLDYGERVLTKEENADYNRGIIRGEQVTGQPMNATFIIQVGDEEVSRKVLSNLQDMAKSNGEPITIG